MNALRFSMWLRCAAFAIAVVLFVPPAEAAIIRHDVPDSEYVNFALDPMFEATGWLAGYTADGGFVAGSAVLIAPQWVLTAGHIVDPQYNSGYPSSWTGMAFSLDSSIYDDSIANNLIQADAWFASPDFGPGFVNAGGGDLGLVHLTQPVLGVTPAVRSTVAAQIGDLIYATGYGRHAVAGNGPGDFDGIERAGTNMIYNDPFSSVSNYMFYRFDQPSFSSITPLEIQGSPLDSGGAWFNTQGELIGINSFVYNNFDTYSYGSSTAATRVLLYNDWIDSYVTPVPEPATMMLLGSSAPFLVAARKRRKKASEVG